MLVALCIALAACSDSSGDDDNVPAVDEEDETTAQTLIMFYPYSGNLLSAFNDNIADMMTVVQGRGGLGDRRIVIYICQSATKAYKIEMVDEGGRVVLDTIATETFTSMPYADAAGMASLISSLEETAPAESYAMIIGCHGMGWLPAGADVTTTADAKGTATVGDIDLPTRYFGHSSSAAWQCDISVLADGITATGMPMDYILFDACYMANIETAYELRDATHYLIASPAEIMAAGVPYAVAGSYLLDMDYEGFCSAFISYYTATSSPYATISVTDCSQVEAMAEVMCTIYAAGNVDISTSTLQTFDGISPHIFYDLGDYVEQLCGDDDALYADFETALALLVPYSRHTSSFYSAYNKRATDISTYSGLTISEPSVNSAADTWAQTAWAAATGR